ncbi:MAG: tetratricopeptide repeat protein [Panacagrimonas sp.]
MNRTIYRVAAAAALLFVAQGVLAAGAVDEAQALINQGRLDAALQRLDVQLKKAPQDAEARFLRGLVLTRLKRTEEAIKAFADITRDYPQLPEPYNNLAVLYAQQGDYEKARDALEAALATHPSYATAHENLGDIYAALAGAAYNRALALDESNQAVKNKLSFVNSLNPKSGRPVPPPAVASAPDNAAPVAALPSPTAPTPAAAPATALAPAIPPPSAEGAGEAVDDATTSAVNAALGAWADAWSARDVDAYLAAYSEDFRPEGGLSRQTWSAQRRDRITRPSRIKVSVVNPSLAALGDGRVRVNFRQEYESDSFADQVSKVIELRNQNGWKIVREYTR